MPLRALGWVGFVFLGAGLLILLFGPREWRSFGCGALMTAVMVYGWGLWTVARQIAGIRRRAEQMLERAAEEMDKKKR
ncbi:MAG TPA: hypothetical protein VGK61_02835 [Planctomycetota bacterium]|jgi:hypothetical protein